MAAKAHGRRTPFPARGLMSALGVWRSRNFRLGAEREETNRMSAEKVIVLGAGFQGVCVALGLQRRGYAVTLVDKASDCMTRASLRNEGKIHLGFVYANDTSFRSSALMLHSSLAFAGLIEEWLKVRINWPAVSSHPFVYVIAHDSLLPPENLFASYERLQRTYQERLDTKEVSYLGSRPSTLWRE